MTMKEIIANLESLNKKRQSPLKDMVFEGVLIKDVPIEVDSQYSKDDEAITVDTFLRLCDLIYLYPDKKVIHFDD